jgi:hypothetical protein
MNRPPEYWLRKARLYFTLHHEELKAWRAAETAQTTFCDKCLNNFTQGCLLSGKKRVIFHENLEQAQLFDTFFGFLPNLKDWHCGEWVKNV